MALFSAGGSFYRSFPFAFRCDLAPPLGVIARPTSAGKKHRTAGADEKSWNRIGGSGMTEAAQEICPAASRIGQGFIEESARCKPLDQMVEIAREPSPGRGSFAFEMLNAVVRSDGHVTCSLTVAISARS